MSENKKETRAFVMLNSVKSVKDRALQYSARIKTTLEVEMIHPLIEKVNKIDDEIYALEDFSLETDLNKGLRKLTKEDCEQRFKKIIELKYARALAVMERDSKIKAFNDLFGEGAVTVDDE